MRNLYILYKSFKLNIKVPELLHVSRLLELYTA